MQKAHMRIQLSSIKPHIKDLQKCKLMPVFSPVCFFVLESSYIFLKYYLCYHVVDLLLEELMNIFYIFAVLISNTINIDRYNPLWGP